MKPSGTPIRRSHIPSSSKLSTIPYLYILRKNSSCTGARESMGMFLPEIFPDGDFHVTEMLSAKGMNLRRLTPMNMIMSTSRTSDESAGMSKEKRPRASSLEDLAYCSHEEGSAHEKVSGSMVASSVPRIMLPLCLTKGSDLMPAEASAQDEVVKAAGHRCRLSCPGNACRPAP